MRHLILLVVGVIAIMVVAAIALIALSAGVPGTASPTGLGSAEMALAEASFGRVDDGVVQCRTQWPVGQDLRVLVTPPAHWEAELREAQLRGQRTARLVVSEGPQPPESESQAYLEDLDLSVHEVTTGHPAVPVWRDFSRRLPRPAGERTRVSSIRLSLIDPSSRREMTSAVVPVDIQLVSSAEDVLHPWEDEALDERMHRSLRIEYDDFGWPPLVKFSLPDLPPEEELALGLHFEIRDRDSLLFSAEFWRHPRTGGDLQWNWVRLTPHTTPQELAEHIAPLDRWTFVLRGDADLSLLTLNGTSYWDGSVTGRLVDYSGPP